jgi:hypothetical protein
MSLWGTFFANRATTEFKRIRLSVQIARPVPPDTPAYAKGGELPVAPGSAPRAAGQIVVGGDGRTPVTFASS